MIADDWYPGDLPENVVIGEGSSLYSRFAMLHLRSRRENAVTVGTYSGIYNGSFFDLGFSGEVIIGDFVTVVGCMFSTNSRIEIGDYTFISHEVVMADTAFARPRPASGVAPSDPNLDIVVGQDAWIGLRAVLLGGAHIGRGAIVGAGAVVSTVVPDYAVVAGNPASVVGWARPQEAFG